MAEAKKQAQAFQLNRLESVTENNQRFLTFVEGIDPEMAKILRENWTALEAIVVEGERNSTKRGAFNSSVVAAIEKVVTATHEKKSP